MKGLLLAIIIVTSFSASGEIFENCAQESRSGETERVTAEQSSCLAILGRQGAASSVTARLASHANRLTVQLDVNASKSGEAFSFIVVGDLSIGCRKYAKFCDLVIQQPLDSGLMVWETFATLPAAVMERPFRLSLGANAAGVGSVYVDGQLYAEIEPFAFAEKMKVKVSSPPEGRTRLYQVTVETGDAIPLAGRFGESGSSPATLSEESGLPATNRRYGVRPDSPPTKGVIKMPKNPVILRRDSGVEMSHKVRSVPVIHFKKTDKRRWKIVPEKKRIEKE